MRCMVGCAVRNLVDRPVPLRWLVCLVCLVCPVCHVCLVWPVWPVRRRVRSIRRVLGVAAVDILSEGLVRTVVSSK